MSNRITSIGENIRAIRTKQGLTQRELATMIGKSYSSIQKYEMDKALPPLSVIEKLADVLSVDKYEIIGWNDFVICALENEKAPASEEAEAITREQSDRLYNALVAAGLITEDDLVAEDIQFLGHIVDLIEDWFSRKHAE